MTPHQKTRTVVIISVSLAIALALLFLLPLFLRSQQGTYIMFLSRAKQVGVALKYHHDQHGVWPATLDAIDSDFSASPEMLTYPALRKLPIDIRDLPKNYPTERWLYFPPTSEDPSQIILAAPLPFESSSDRMLRIVVRADISCEVVEELVFGKAIEKQSQAEQDVALDG